MKHRRPQLEVLYLITKIVDIGLLFMACGRFRHKKTATHVCVAVGGRLWITVIFSTSALARRCGVYNYPAVIRLAGEAVAEDLAATLAHDVS